MLISKLGSFRLLKVMDRAKVQRPYVFGPEVTLTDFRGPRSDLADISGQLASRALSDLKPGDVLARRGLNFLDALIYLGPAENNAGFWQVMRPLQMVSQEGDINYFLNPSLIKPADFTDDYNIYRRRRVVFGGEVVMSSNSEFLQTLVKNPGLVGADPSFNGPLLVSALLHHYGYIFIPGLKSELDECGIFWRHKTGGEFLLGCQISSGQITKFFLHGPVSLGCLPSARIKDCYGIRFSPLPVSDLVRVIARVNYYLSSK